MSKNILIVFVHPEHKSFNGQLFDVAKKTLASEGHKVEISDLYKMEFDPVISRKDIKGDLANPDNFVWVAEIMKAYAENRTADDIQSEQRKLDAADLVIFQFPMYWFGFPAILKGWVDRVMHVGYSSGQPDRTFDNAHFKGKKAVLSFTTGGSADGFSSHGQQGDMDIVLWSLQNGFLRYVGYDVLAPNWVENVYGTNAHRERLDSWSTRLKTIFNEKPLQFLPNSVFQGKRLADDVRGEYGPTVGQHCGLKIPPGSQTTAPKI